MPFKKGGPPGPGRPKGSIGGRRKFLQTMDKLLDDPKVQERLKLCMAGKIAGDPEGFIKELLFPMLPKESLVSIDGEQKATVRIVGMDPAGDAQAAAMEAREQALREGEN